MFYLNRPYHTQLMLFSSSPALYETTTSSRSCMKISRVPTCYRNCKHTSLITFAFISQIRYISFVEKISFLWLSVCGTSYIYIMIRNWLVVCSKKIQTTIWHTIVYASYFLKSILLYFIFNLHFGVFSSGISLTVESRR